MLRLSRARHVELHNSLDASQTLQGFRALVAVSCALLQTASFDTADMRQDEFVEVQEAERRPMDISFVTEAFLPIEMAVAFLYRDRDEIVARGRALEGWFSQ